LFLFIFLSVFFFAANESAILCKQNPEALTRTKIEKLTPSKCQDDFPTPFACRF
jgi:hypothetical protein